MWVGLCKRGLQSGNLNFNTFVTVTGLVDLH